MKHYDEETIQLWDKEIAKIDRQIVALRKLRQALVAQKLKAIGRPSDDVQALVNFVRTSPGCTKKDIRSLFDDKKSESEINDLIRSARRNWEMIENRGTRNSPRWYPTLKKAK